MTSTAINNLTLGLTFNIGFTYHIREFVSKYIWLLRIDRIKYVSSLRIKNNRLNRLSDIRYFLKIITFRLIILVFPSPENVDGKDISRCEVENEKKMGRKLTDLTDERWPKKKPQNHPSTVSRVLKEITQSPKHSSRIYSDEEMSER